MIESVKTISRVKPPYPFEAYAHIISPLQEEDGGGYMISFPDLPGCMSDGETEAKAIENGRDAFRAWISAYADSGKTIPAPTFRPEFINLSRESPEFVKFLPKLVYDQLFERAEEEGVGLDALVLTYIAEGLNRRESHI